MSTPDQSPACVWERDCLQRTGMPSLAEAMRCTPNDSRCCTTCASKLGRPAAEAADPPWAGR